MTSEPGSRDVLGNHEFNFDVLLLETGDGTSRGSDGLNLSQTDMMFDELSSDPTNADDFVPSASQENPIEGIRTTNTTEHCPGLVRSESTTSSTTIEGIVDLLFDIEQSVPFQPKPVNTQLSVENIENELRIASATFSEEREAQAVKTAINRLRQPMIRMRAQPVRRQRFRYGADGRRFLKNSRGRPMSINLPPGLTGCLTKPCQSFWIQATLVTTRNNPHQKVFLHQHIMQYNGEGARENGFQSFRIRLTDEDIRRRIKRFKRTSITKTKQRHYNFDLVPFDPLLPGDHIIRYTTEGEERLDPVKKAKCFDREYHTENFQIVCELMLKQNEQWYPMDLSCATHTITDA